MDREQPSSIEKKKESRLELAPPAELPSSGNGVLRRIEKAEKMAQAKKLQYAEPFETEDGSEAGGTVKDDCNQKERKGKNTLLAYAPPLLAYAPPFEEEKVEIEAESQVQPGAYAVSGNNSSSQDQSMLEDASAHKKEGKKVLKLAPPFASDEIRAKVGGYGAIETKQHSLPDGKSPFLNSPPSTVASRFGNEEDGRGSANASVYDRLEAGGKAGNKTTRGKPVLEYAPSFEGIEGDEGRQQGPSTPSAPSAQIVTNHQQRIGAFRVRPGNDVRRASSVLSVTDNNYIVIGDQIEITRGNPDDEEESNRDDDPIRAELVDNYPKAEVVKGMELWLVQTWKVIMNSRFSIISVLIAIILSTTITGLLLSRNSPLNTTTKDQISEMILKSEFSDATFLIADTPQRAALDWLVGKYDKGISMNKTDILTQYSLLSFYYSMNGNAWKSNKNWLGEEAYCNWDGIECDDDREVVKLNLSNNNINGTLSTEIAKLTTLVELDLSGNGLTTIPAEVFGGLFTIDLEQNLCVLKGGLQRLESLKLQNNKIETIPDNIGLLQNLTELDISNNIIQPVPEEIALLPVLDFLWLQGNDFSDVGKLKELLISLISKKFPKTGTAINETETPQYQFVQMIVDDIDEITESKEDLWQQYVLQHHVTAFIESKLPSPRDDIRREGTAQYFAIKWIIKNDDSTTISFPGNEEKILELYGLAVFYYSTDGDNWNQKNNWLNASAELRDWHGVKNIEEQIIELDLRNNNLKGTVPDEVAFLGSINSIDLSDNGLYGVSKELGK